MTMKLIAPGRGERRDACIVYHLDPSAGEIQGRIRSAAPDAIIINDTSAVGGYYLAPPTLAATLEFARKQSGALGLGRVVLVGFSAGCQAVRFHLASGAEPDAIVAVDGTHCSIPPNERTQIWPWKSYAEKALEGGGVVLVASHSSIKPPNFLSSRETLELVTGWSLPRLADGRRQEGRLVVLSAAGVDAAAHISQARNMLPRMLAEAMDLMGVAPKSLPPSAPPPPGPSAIPFNEALSLVAQEDLALMHREVGHNAGPWVAKLLKRFGLVPPNNYCAAGVSEWLARAAKLSGKPSPVPGSPGAKALMAQFQAAQLWLPKHKASSATVRPGFVPVWHRGPVGAWTGHTGVVIACEGGSFFTVEANGPAPSDFAVSMNERLFSDPLLLGFGVTE